mmetsp:Transcript_95722/g.241235  ORF Transcript_95722/g.241235 Transcript_95722/m.241235 type:complete len:505 (+) Transcript_95722:66-1580(+)
MSARTGAGKLPLVLEEVSEASMGKTRRRISAYFPSRATRAQAPQRAAILKLGLFVFFILTRAFHPMLIDLSKHDGKILYAKNTPVVMNKIFTIVLMNSLALLGGGLDGLRLCWQPRCMAVFGLIGTIYALGDFLEMQSMSKLGGGVYQVLLQTKLLITALMLWWLKGSKQSSLQWHVLFSMFLAMSCFVLVDQGSDGGSGAGSLPLMGVMCVMLKVAVSCYCAVLSEKYLKAFSDMPLYAKISGLATTWAMASLLMSSMEPQVQQEGFFAHWDGMTCLVALSFTVKTISTMYLLQALDSLQKNIGEALAVIVIYVSQVTLPGLGKSFELSVFLLAVLVVGLVKTYLISPKVGAAKAKKQSLHAPAQDTKLVSLNSRGTALMQNIGIDTMTCEVAEALPSGVFYGMLGGVHPVCGNTHPSSPNHCELMLLSHPPVTPGDIEASKGCFDNAAAKAAPFLPSQSLTVLGHVRDPLPREKVSADQCMKDLEQARTHLQSRCAAAVNAT